MAVERGLNIFFTPIQPKAVLDNEYQETICTRLNNFIYEEEIEDVITNKNFLSLHVVCNDSFSRPVLVASRNREDKNIIDLCVFSGNRHFMEFKKDMSKNTVDIVDYSFDDSYLAPNIDDWFENTLKAFEITKRKGHLKWHLKNTTEEN